MEEPMAKKTKKPLLDYIEPYGVVIGRDDDYEIHIVRDARNNGWAIRQGPENAEDTPIISLPDDEAMEAFLAAARRLKDLVDESV
jgi:hypothetical protein